MRPQPPRKKKRGFFGGCLLVFVILLSLIGAGTVVFAISVGSLAKSAPDAIYRATTKPQRDVNQSYVQVGDRKQKIVIIPVHGIIQNGAGGRYAAPSEMLIDFLKEAREQKVGAVILDLNTPGGEMTATDEVYHELLKLREAGIPTVSCMRSVCASGGYYLAAGTDHIIANRLTFTGSIGVIMGGINYGKLLERWDIKPEVYKSGELKDFMNMSRERSEREAAMVQGMIDEAFLEFAQVVADGRGELEVAAILEGPIGDAGVFSGTRALELRLVDELGYLEDAIDKAAELAGFDDPSVVRYGSMPGLLDSLLGAKAAPPSLQQLIAPAHAAIKPGQLYFLCPIGLLK